MNEQTNKKFKNSGVAGVCYGIGFFSMLIGLVMIVFGLANAASSSSAAGALSFFGSAIALVFGALGWVVIGKVITLLAQIAYNTQPKA